MAGPRPEILVIDDEQPLHRVLRPLLEANGYRVTQALTGAEGLGCLSKRAPDVLILDLGLPDQDGHAVLQEIRIVYQGPVLVLSGRTETLEKIKAFDTGADDYVQKPFTAGELLARLRVLLRPAGLATSPASGFRAEGLDIDFRRRQVTRDGVAADLSPRETQALALLVRAGGKVLTHGQILSGLSGRPSSGDVKYLRVLIGKLRQKVEVDPRAPVWIRTEAGVGYSFRPGAGMATRLED